MNAKKLALLAVVLFIGFWMFTDPSGLADIATTGAGEGWDLLTVTFEAIIRFVKEMF